MNNRAEVEKNYKTKRFIVVLIVLAIISVGITGIIVALPRLKRTEVELAKQQTESIEKNFTTEQTESQTWDISATEDDHVTATFSSDGVLTISGTGNQSKK